MLSRRAGSPAMVLITVCIVQFMAPFMLTAVGVALPSLGRDVGASAVQLGLVEQLYILSVAMTMLTFGRLGDIVGQRKVFLPGLIVFTVLTLSLGFTRSVEMIMIQRFFQGIGASMMLAGSLALVAAAYPAEVRGMKIGIVSACTYTGLSAGPVLGGYVTTHFGWRSVFLMSAPLGLSAITMCIAGMGGVKRNASDEPMDWSGALATFGMLTTFIGLLLTAMTVGVRTPLWLLGVELIFIGAGFGIFITPNSAAIMGSVEPRRFGVASGMVGAMRTLGMAVSMTTVALIFSLIMGDAAIKPSTLPKFLDCMRLGLTAFAVFSCLGIGLSVGRGKRRSGVVEREPTALLRS